MNETGYSRLWANTGSVKECITSSTTSHSSLQSAKTMVQVTSVGPHQAWHCTGLILSRLNARRVQEALYPRMRHMLTKAKLECQTCQVTALLLLCLLCLDLDRLGRLDKFGSNLPIATFNLWVNSSFHDCSCLWPASCSSGAAEGGVAA